MANDDPVVVIRQADESGFISGLLLGAVVGALVGLMRAPASGGQTRQRLLQKVRPGSSQKSSNDGFEQSGGTSPSSGETVRVELEPHRT